MANINAGLVGANSRTLTPNTVDTVTFPDEFGSFRVVSDGAAKIYIRVDGKPPAVGSDDAWEIPALPAVITIPTTSLRPHAISLISAGAATYSVAGVGDADE